MQATRSASVAILLLWASSSGAACVKAAVVFTTDAEAQIPAGETMATWADDREASFNDLYVDKRGSGAPSNFCIEVIGVFRSAYDEDTSPATVYLDAEAGTVQTTDNKTMEELRRSTGADIVIVETTASDFLVTYAISRMTPVDETNFLIVHWVDDPNAPDGETWLHEVLHLLGANEDADPNCFQHGDGEKDFCAAENTAFQNGAANMEQYGETAAANDPPPVPTIQTQCLGAFNWEITFTNDSGIFDVILERRSGSGAWSTTWTGADGICLVRSGSFSYRGIYVDVFGNQSISLVKHTNGNCGAPN